MSDLTKQTPVAPERSVDFKPAELAFVSNKLSSHQFEIELVPQKATAWIYPCIPPHTMFIGEVVDVIER